MPDEEKLPEDKKTDDKKTSSSVVSKKNSGKKFWIGFDLGGTKMLTIAYDDDWKELGRRRRKTRGREGSDSGSHRIISTITRLLDENELDVGDIAGIGIGCPGPIDLVKGDILSTPNLGWDDVQIGSLLTKHFKCPTVVLNDVDAGVFGEYQFGAAKGSRCAVGIFPGTGVGGGCVYEGKILQGAGISCMEIGHTKIASSTRGSGFAIPGTVESEASRLTIAAEAAKAAIRGDAPYLFKKTGTDVVEIRSGAIADSIENGDKVVRKLVEEAAEAIGMAVMNIVHILAPDKIILGGGLVEAMEDLIVSTVKKTAQKSVMSVYKDRFDVVAAKLGDDAGVLGAAAWAKEQITKSKKG
ncbi:ROK family protein [Rubripirellula amarantea]|uniref:Glucokinase n=1 Tax=Rubripirellula amarantea TaxID=2527999 RepID=A0A5C5WRS1_9BACT|nr:ROK family protein [Rubripirellula amarantea]MDA8744195.1 ROK family protein [Rubripirellula amarantea]TWT53268.1 Glucokinase [Rubripirellula amarantea]